MSFIVISTIIIIVSVIVIITILMATVLIIVFIVVVLLNPTWVSRITRLNGTCATSQCVPTSLDVRILQSYDRHQHLWCGEQGVAIGKGEAAKRWGWVGEQEHKEGLAE